MSRNTWHDWLRVQANEFDILPAQQALARIDTLKQAAHEAQMALRDTQHQLRIAREMIDNRSEHDVIRLVQCMEILVEVKKLLDGHDWKYGGGAGLADTGGGCVPASLTRKHPIYARISAALEKMEGAP